MVPCAERTARADGGASRRFAGFALSAITLIALALAQVLGPVPLTLAMGAMGLAAALLDRRFDMDLLGLFVAAGTALIFWRLGLPGGLLRATGAPLADIVVAYGGILALLAATALALRTRNRWRGRTGAEAAGWTLLTLFATLLVDRIPGAPDSHWGAGIVAALWLVSAGHLWWRRAGGCCRHGAALAGLHLAIGLLLLLYTLTLGSPLVTGRVAGPAPFDTLAVAYLLPALALGLMAWRLPGLPPGRGPWRARRQAGWPPGMSPWKSAGSGGATCCGAAMSAMASFTAILWRRWSARPPCCTRLSRSAASRCAGWRWRGSR
jgi:hypothetical protein